MNSFFVKVALLPIACTPMLVRADVVFSNVTGTGTVIGFAAVCGSATPACAPTGLLAAEEFTPAANYGLTDAKMLVATIGGSPPTFEVFLYSNSSGVPGSEIEQIGFSLTATTRSPGALITANSIATPITLVSGTPYWLVLAPATSTSFVLWSIGGSPAVPFAASLNGGVNWTAAVATGQFQIDGTVVPEPSSFGLLAGILMLFYGIRRRQRKAL